MTADLVARVQAGPTEVIEELKARLALKEKLFQEMLSDRSRQSNEHHVQVQDLLNTLSSKDQYLQVGHVSQMLMIINMQAIVDMFNFFTHLSYRTTPTGSLLLLASRPVSCRSSANSCR